jgi:fructose-1,6-bisphosphatase I
MKHILQKGKNQVCAGYSMYGSCTSIILATHKSVNGFTLDPVSGEFLISHPNLQLKKKGKIYSVNEGNAKSWNESTSTYVSQRKELSSSLRYVGSMVADIHRTLLVGGIFMYPADKKSP